MNRRTAVPAIVLLAVNLGCRDVQDSGEAGRGPAPEVVAAATRRAADAATGLTADLFTEMARVQIGVRPEEALAVCGDIAARLTERIARREGLTVRRTALRVRNPANTPDAYERAVLEHWAQAGARVAPHAGVARNAAGDYEFRYLRPITMQPACVVCHGATGSLSDAVRIALLARYPDDRATGFAPGDVRGAVSVRVPLAVPPERRDRPGAPAGEDAP